MTGQLEGQALDDAEPTVVTVTTQAIPVAASSASVTILSRDYIENSHAETAADVLRNAPFLQIAQSGAIGGLTTVTVRGAKPNFTLVMIDGIPVNDITNILGGSFDLSSLAISNIDRVEIVRGPLSSVYGSDAVGGVINFISRKRSTTTVFNASGELGSFLRKQVRVSGAGKWKGLQYSGGGTWIDIGQQVLNDGYSAASAEFNGSLDLGRNLLLDFTTHWLHGRSSGFPAGSGGPELAILRQAMTDRSNELVVGSGLKHQFRRWWLYNVDIDLVRRTEDNSTPGVLDRIPPSFRSLPSSVANTDFTRLRFGANSSFIMPRNFSLLIGAGLRQEIGSTDGFLAGTIPQSFHVTRTSLLPISELQYSGTRLTATAGVSMDKSSRFGEVSSPRFGVTWLMAERGPRLRMTWAEGFKLPSFYALGNPSVGNPSLRPERAKSFDTGIEQPFQRTHTTVSLAYFRNDFTDLVDFDSTTFHLINRSRAIIEGLELSAVYSPGNGFRAGTDFVYTAWSLQQSAQPLRNIPHGNGGIHIDWKVSARLSTRVDTQWMGRRYDFQIPVPNQQSVGGYSGTNLSAAYDLDSKTAVYARIDNVFNSRYHEYIGFPNPGIAIRCGLLYRAK
jgi:iron complex outermembrane receptor protein/vitamin B12 transporter